MGEGKEEVDSLVTMASPSMHVAFLLGHTDAI